jgi:hypothetical protein
MSFVSHDLICENGHGMPQEVYRRSEGPPPCEHCGSPTHIGWFSGAAPGFTGFGTMNVDGREMSTGDFESYRRNLEASNPGKRVKVESYTDRQVDQRIDERRQRVADSRKARGIDVQAVAEQRVESAVKKLEAAERGNLPSKAVDAARTQVVKTANSFKKTA